MFARGPIAWGARVALPGVLFGLLALAVAAPCAAEEAFLQRSGSALTLMGNTPGLGDNLKFADSPKVATKLNNPWAPVGTWAALFDAPVLAVAGEVNVWVGLKNSDDQGTRFDLRAEAWVFGKDADGQFQLSLVGEGVVHCLTGLTRNANRARNVVVPLEPVFAAALAEADALLLRILTRIGTTESGSPCPGPGGSHASAAGLRLYYGSFAFPAKFTFFPLAP